MSKKTAAKTVPSRNAPLTKGTPSDFTPYEMPTAIEIANLAVPLMIGDKRDQETYMGAVGNAIRLWLEAHRQLPRLKVTLSRMETIKQMTAQMPHLACEWPKSEDNKRLIVPYTEGLTALFPRDKKDRRDGLMLELLVYIARNEPNPAQQGREDWKRLKSQGFTYLEFSHFGFCLDPWRQKRKSSASSQNAKKRGAKKTKK